jgi:putative ABC transport system permease protein
MTYIRDDVRYAWRGWVASLKARGSVIPVILTLALGIGATTAMFGLVHGLLNVLPYRQPEQLVMLWQAKTESGSEELRLSLADYLDFVAQSRSFTRLAIYRMDYHNLAAGDGVERVRAPQIESTFFPVLGVRVMKGRDFSPDDANRSAAVALLSERLWRRQFAGWADPIGKTVRVDGTERTVVGIVPRGQEFPPAADMWLPMALTLPCCMRTGHSYQAIGRLKDGVSLAQARTEMKAIAARLEKQYPESNTNTTARVEPLRDQLIGEAKPAMWILAVATASLLLMACVSVASILFARGAYRGTEIAVRKVLGATRRRIIVQLLLESALSAVVASALGIFVARLILHLFLRIVPEHVPQVQALSIDLRAAGFALAAALLTALIFGLLPALYATHGNLMLSIRGGGLSRALGGSQRVRSGLIVLENTVAFALLVTSILLFNSLIRLTDVDPGFDPKGALGASLNLASERYASPPQVISFYNTLLERLRSLPGVEAAGVVDAMPMTGSTEGKRYSIVGAPPKPAGEEPRARISVASPGYFKSMGIRLLQGRDFGAADGEQSHVIVISQAMARANWPNASPIGKRVGIVGIQSLSWEVIGVVVDVKDDGLAVPALPRIYLNQQEFGVPDMTVVVRSSRDAGAMVGTLRREVNSLDPELPLFDVTTVEDLVNESLARNRTVASIVGAFSVMALILAGVGLYGVMLSNLVRRTREFGIRIAVGSAFRNIAWLVLREGLLLVLIGMAIGLAISYGSTRILSSLLFGIGGTDLPSYLSAALMLLLVATAGCLVLLRRISRLDPVTALKYE